MNTDTRNRNLARVHIATDAVGLKGEKYQAWLKRRTGKESCADLTDAQLSKLVDWLKPTRAQWQMVGSLAREIGLSGFEDEGFRTFVLRVTKEADPHLLTRLQMPGLIAGLKGWAKHRRQAGPPPAPGTPDQPGAKPTDTAPTEGRIPHDPKEKAPTVASGQGL
jgi:hypothetical protein